MKLQVNTIIAVVALAATFFVAGCSAGDQPPGMTADDAKAAIERMPPEQKIKAIAGSPMPDAEKQQRYAEIEAKTGVKAKDVLGNRPVTSGK